jgi:hypothetical protein
MHVNRFHSGTGTNADGKLLFHFFFFFCVLHVGNAVRGSKGELDE